MKVWFIISAIAVAGIIYGAYRQLEPGAETRIATAFRDKLSEERSIEERIAKAHERASKVKGVYMTAAVANDQGRPATHLRNEIVRLLDTTEVNAVVIDVKETKGSEITPNLKPFLEELHQKGVWTIARIPVFRDSSQVREHPDYYFKRKSDGGIWRDVKGHAWMDPMSPGARKYILSFSQEVIGEGFDELQYDYIRFPSDGNLRDLVYTYPKEMEGSDALADFLAFLEENVRREKPEIILSADIFGYVAVEGREYTVGQKLTDFGRHFDFISPMIYPSHYFSGLILDADTRRGLPAVNFPYRGAGKERLVSGRFYDVIFRSLARAEDILSGVTPIIGERTSTSTASTTPDSFRTQFKAKFRPFLQDFDLGADTSRGIYYDAKAVRDQIDAAEAAGASGWLLWSPTNVYTEAALKPKEKNN